MTPQNVGYAIAVCLLTMLVGTVLIVWFVAVVWFLRLAL